jgi:hypothetical protein
MIHYIIALYASCIAFFLGVFFAFSANLLTSLALAIPECPLCMVSTETWQF